MTMNETVKIKKSKEEIISAFRLMIAKKKAWNKMLKRISKEYGKNGLVFLFEYEYTRSRLCKSTGSIQGMD